MTPSASIPRPPPTNPAPVWHAQSTDAALAALAATAQGLTQAEAEQRLAAHGPNSLPTPPAPSALMRLLRQFNNLLLYVLMAAATVTAFMGHWVDTCEVKHYLARLPRNALCEVVPRNALLTLLEG